MSNRDALHSQKNMLLLFSGTFLSFIIFYASLILLPLYAVKLGGSEFATGLQTTIFFTASILMRIYFGPLTDQKGRKLPLLIGAFVFATAPLLFIFAHSMFLLTLARIYHAIGLAAFFSSGASLVADIAPVKKIGLYMGVYRITSTLALLGGPATALYIADTAGFQTWFWISFFMGMVSVMILSLVKSSPAQADSAASTWERYRVILHQKNVWPIYFGVTLTAVGSGVLLTFAVLYVSRVTTIANPAYYFTGYSLAGVAGNLIAGHLSDRFGRPVVAWPMLIVLSTGVISLFFLPFWPAIFLASSLLAGFGYSGATLALIAWLVEATDQSNRGTVLALQESTIDFGMAVGSGVFGSITGLLGMANSFLALGLAVAACSGYFFCQFHFSRQTLAK